MADETVFGDPVTGQARAVVGVIDGTPQVGVVGGVGGRIGATGTDTDADVPTTPVSTASGLYEVDCLLFGDSYRWNAADMVGMPVTVTYSFMAAKPAYYDDTEVIGFQPFTAAMQDAARSALAKYAAVANVSFVEVSDAGTGGQIRFGSAELDPRVAGYSYLALPGSEKAGDVWLSDTVADNLAPSSGGYGYLTYLHEIGHALGLKHPGNYDAGGGSTPGPYLPAAEDNTDETVMSYVIGDVHFPTDLGPLDRLAIEYVYGPKTATTIGHLQSGGDTDDRLAGDAADNALIGNGGADTLDGGAGNDGLLGGAGNDVADGGAGNDRAYGNQGRDTLYGGGGADTLYGGQDADLLSGGDGADQLFGNVGDDTLAGGSGADVFHVGQGADTITDFTPGTDHIQVAWYLNGAVVVGADLLSRTSDGAGGAVVDLGGGNSVTLLGVAKASLHAGDFALG